jgi:hypothetical protein
LLEKFAPFGGKFEREFFVIERMRVWREVIWQKTNVKIPIDKLFKYKYTYSK